MPAQFKLSKTSNDQYRFSLTAENNKKILSSETYKSKDAAKGGIHSVQANAPLDARYESKTASNGKFYFVLKAANHEIIGTSEMYDTEAGCKNGIEAVKRVAPTAAIQDQTG